jgi:hypothetical protein
MGAIPSHLVSTNRRFARRLLYAIFGCTVATYATVLAMIVGR